MTVWYHPKYHLFGHLARRPKYGPIFFYNSAPYRIYVSEGRNAYPLKVAPQKAGWVFVGYL